jgi:hypothetical protein
MKIFPLFFFLFGLVALILGIIILFNDGVLIALQPQGLRTGLAIVLVIYGSYRVWTGLGAIWKIQHVDDKK